MTMLFIEKPEGITCYPFHTSGQSEPTLSDPYTLAVFLPSAEFKTETHETWVCSIESDHGAVVVETTDDLRKLIIALEIAFDQMRRGKK